MTKNQVFRLKASLATGRFPFVYLADETVYVRLSKRQPQHPLRMVYTLDKRTGQQVTLFGPQALSQGIAKQ